VLKQDYLHVNYLERNQLQKRDFQKKYRHPELDDRLTKERMRAELRGILRCKANGIKTPAVYFVDSKKNTIYMEEFENVQTVNVFIGNELKESGSGDSSIPSQKLKPLASEIGSIVGKMHAEGIIHGDLTTSNILIENENQSSNANNLLPEVSLIDFGLSHVNSTAEDKGVDLYVLERALLSTHSSIPWFFEFVLDSYKLSNRKDGQDVLRKLDEIRLRGRKREMIG